jgi:predicted RNA binding protein YcfA (HicA-like mRNA interferase family)
MQDPGEEIWSLELPREFVDDIASALGDKRELEIGRRHTLPSSASETPWDLCAWYQPIHFHPSDWGIYIKEDCLLRLAVAIALSVDQQAYQAEKAASRQAKYWRLGDAGVFARAAFVLLFLHEHYHHRIECLGVRLHVVTRKGLYVPYVRGVYSPSKGTDDLLEEALANACMYLRIDEATYKDCLPQTVREAMKALLRSRFPYEPPGYRLAVNYLDQPRFDAGENRLQGWVRETSMSPVQPSWEWDVAPRMTQSFLHIQSNIYTVVPRGRKHHLPTTYFPYSCSTEQMVSICRKRGYQEVPGGGKGAHRKFTKAGAPPVILPPRKDLSIGVIKNTLAAIGGYRLKDLPNLMR